MAAASSNKLKYVVFLGSTREGRLGERVAKYVVNKLSQSGIDVTLVDPLEDKYNFEMLKKPLHFYGRDTKNAPANLVLLNDKIVKSDGIIVVSAEYNHSIPPALANTMDHFGGSSYAWKPSAIVTYSPGMFGGVRAAMQLRSFLGELGCISVSNILAIPHINQVLDPSGNPIKESSFDIDRASVKLLDQIKWWAEAAKTQRNSKDDEKK